MFGKDTFMNDASMTPVPVCVLAGGLSTRLRPITDSIPKPMVDVGGQPFLKRVLDHLDSLGHRRFILAVSYRWEVIRDYFGDGGDFGWDIAYSVEPEPMGTGGAVLWAQPMWGERALVLNGDTFLPGDWRAMVSAHAASDLAATMALVPSADATQFGSVQVADGRVVAFHEKPVGGGAGWINGGVYVLESAVLAGRRRGDSFSLEREIFTALAGRMGAFMCEGVPFADIGTADALDRFRQDAGTWIAERSAQSAVG